MNINKKQIKRQMKKCCLVVMMAICSTAVFAQRKVCIDSDWKFHYGDGGAAVQNPGVTDSWRTLTLPHDWSVETEAAAQAGGQVIGPFSTNSIGGFQTGFTVGGEGWYMKTINVTAEELKGQVCLYLEGAYNQSWVYVNGKQCHFNPYGYSSYKFDISDHLHEGENTIFVKVANTGNNTRWYAGSGIYRHVWLIRTSSLYAEEWDTYVRTEDNNKVLVTTTINNLSSLSAKGTVEVKILDADQNVVATTSTMETLLDAKGSKEVSAELSVENVKTWSPDAPNLYQAVINVKNKDGEVTDEITKTFGFRTLSFTATQGFLLNGQPMLIKGGCVHHDNGLLGAAAFDKAERRKLQLIKNLGYNAVRCSHNLPSENFLNVCDEIGLMVIDECFDQWLIEKNRDDYHNYFRQYSDQDIAVMLRRDRNHPSIIMWSIGNEIPGRIEPAGMEVAARLRADVLKYDTTRPVTAAICGWDAGDTWNSAAGNWDVQCEKAFQSLDVGGYNYLFDKYERDHAAAPERVICGLESYPKQASENWNLVEKYPYVIGDFVWTVMDYVGEAGIGCAMEDQQPKMFQDWPYFNGYCGDLDLIGQKKPQSYYKDVVWREKPVDMAVQPTSSYNNAWGWQLEEQSWTWSGYEGKNVSVNVYSRAPQVRLYLNGQSMGDKTPGQTFWAGYSIPYQPGTLRVVNLDASGNELPDEAFELTTTGEATDVRMVYEDKEISADVNDLAYVTIELVDSEGRVVTSDCTTQLEITNEGCGDLIACGTGSPNDMKSFRSNKLTVFRGRALAIVRSNGQAGPVKIRAEVVKKELSFTSFFSE